MELAYRELENGIRMVKLIGKLDNDGVGTIEAKFVSHCAGKQVKVIVDLSKLDFLTHTGCQLLLWNAKEVASRGGKFVLLNPTSSVEQALDEANTKEWCPIYSDFDTATSFLLAAH
jgi:anti-anti-sigma factor